MSEVVFLSSNDSEQSARASVDLLRPDVSLFVRPDPKGPEAPAPADATVAQVSAACFSQGGLACRVERGADGMGWKGSVDVPEGHPWLLMGTTLAERAGFAVDYRTVRPIWHDADHCRSGTEKFSTLAGAITATAVVANKAMQALQESPIGALLYEHFGRPQTAATVMAAIRARLQQSGVWTTRPLDTMEPTTMASSVVHSPLLVVDAVADSPLRQREEWVAKHGVRPPRAYPYEETPSSPDGSRDEGGRVEDGFRRLFPRIDAAMRDEIPYERPSLRDLPYSSSRPEPTPGIPISLHHEVDQHIVAFTVKPRRPTVLGTVDARLAAILDAPAEGIWSIGETVAVFVALCSVRAEASGWEPEAWRERTGRCVGRVPEDTGAWDSIRSILRSLVDLARHPPTEGG